MKRFYKFLTASLLAMTIFAILAFGASAEASAPSIEKKLASFDGGEITLGFAVKGDTGSVKLKIWGSYPISDTPVLYETTEFTEMTLDGASYKVFSSEHVLLQNLRKPYYAAIFALDSKGSEIARSEIIKFSVFDYFLELLGTGTEDQIALFTKLLDMGGAMQRQLLGSAIYSNTEFNAAGGYSDEYYALKENTYVDGTLKSSEISYYAAPTDLRLTAEKAYEGAGFVGFTSKSGAALKEYGELTSSTWNELPFSVTNVGITEVNLNYSTGSALPVGYESISSLTSHGITKDSGTEFSTPRKFGLTTDKKGVASTTIVANSAVASISSKGENKFFSFQKMIKALSATTYADESLSKSGAYKEGELVSSRTVKNCGVYLPAKGVAENANMHVFETDLYVYCTTNTAPTYVKLQNADGETFWGFNVVTAGDGSTFSLTVRGGIDDGKCFTDGITLRQRDWYNLRVEYGFTSGDEVEINVYVDGMLTSTYTSSVAADKDSTLGRVQLYHVDSINNATINIDNTIITSVKAD